MVAQVLRDLLAGGLDRLADAIRVRERPPAHDGHLSAAAAGNEHWLATVRARAPELLTGGGIHVGTPAPARSPGPRHPRPEGGDAPVTAPEPLPATSGAPTFVGPKPAAARRPDFPGRYVEGRWGRRSPVGLGYDDQPRRRRGRRPALRLRRVVAPAVGPDLTGAPVVRQSAPAEASPAVSPAVSPHHPSKRPAPRDEELAASPRQRPSYLDPAAPEVAAPASRPEVAAVVETSRAPAQPPSWEAHGSWPSLPAAPRADRAPQFDTGQREQWAVHLPVAAFPPSVPQQTGGDRGHPVDVEGTGPWPDLPDDSDGWLPPRSVFTPDLVRGLDDEQRCG